MLQLVNQLKQVVRRLLRTPLFTAITLLTLAIGIGANTVVFSVVNGVLLKPLPYTQSDRLVGLWFKAPGVNLPELNMAAFLYFTIREQNKVFDDIGVYSGDAFAVTGNGKPDHVNGLDVSEATLPLLGVKPVLGRLFSHGDDLPNTAKTTVISYGYWQRHFGGNKSAVGSSLTLDGEAHQVIGVLPQNFRFLDNNDADIFVPMQMDRGKTKLGGFNFEGFARLKPGVTMNQANADLGRLIPIAIRSFPAPEGFPVSVFEKAGIQPYLRPLKKDVVGDIGNTLWVLMGSIILVLLVACANVANLLLVRAEGRRQELAIRSALGAGRRNIALSLLFESLSLGVSGALIGLALAYATLRVLVATAPEGLPRLHEINIDSHVLIFALGVTLMVSFAIGLMPVLKFAGLNLNTGMREGGRALSQSRERHRARKTLVVVQVALALVLLICSGLMIRTFRALSNVFPGFTNPSTLQTFRIYIPPTQVPDSNLDRVMQMEQQMSDEIAALPGVSSVALTTKIPMDFNNNNDPVYAEDHTYKPGELAPLRRFKFVSPGFFATMGTPLKAGRDFTWDDEFQKRDVAIISENFAREYWGSAQNAIGQHIRVATTDDWREVVGVAANMYDDGVSKPPPAAVYWPLLRTNFEGQKVDMRRGVAFAIRSPRAGSAEFMNEVRQAVWSVDSDLPLSNTATVREMLSKSMARTSFTLVMLSVAGGMALLLGIVGIYGVIAYAVAQRTREIGIRMALGAQRNSLTGMFVRQGITLALIGVVIGIGVAFASMRLMKSLLYHVSAMDPWTYSVATLVILLVTWLACYIPSRRTAVVDPVYALRAE
ncbi:MAG: ABC transporter permease [Acidobacteriota bacterium]|nr:ABC transporter permease [Acidobacteriota bacterium]